MTGPISRIPPPPSSWVLGAYTFKVNFSTPRMIIFFLSDQWPLIARSNSVAHYQRNSVCCNWPGTGLEMSGKDLFPHAPSRGANFAIGCWIMVPAHNGLSS